MLTIKRNIMRFKFLILKFLGYTRFWLNNKISKKSFYANNTQFIGISNISIGDFCTIGENTRITVNDRTSKDVKVRIFNNVYIGRNNFFTVGGGIEIKEYSILGDNCSFLCSNHCFDNPLFPYSLSGSTINQQISLGVNCWLGINVTIIGNVKVGHGSVIGANSLVTKDIPPFSLVVGNPARIIKRFNFNTQEWDKDLKVPNSDFLNESIYIKYLSNNFGNIPIAYHSSSSIFGNL